VIYRRPLGSNPMDPPPLGIVLTTPGKKRHSTARETIEA